MYLNLTVKRKKYSAPDNASGIIFQSLRYDNLSVDRDHECSTKTLKLFYRPLKIDSTQGAAAMDPANPKELNDLIQLTSKLQVQVRILCKLQNAAAMNPGSFQELSDLIQLIRKIQLLVEAQIRMLRELRNAAEINSEYSKELSDVIQLTMKHQVQVDINVQAQILRNLFVDFKGRLYPEIYCLELDNLHSLSPQKFDQLTTLLKRSIYRGAGLEDELNKFMLALNSARISPEKTLTPSSATSTSASKNDTTAKNLLGVKNKSSLTPPIAQPPASTLAWFTTALCCCPRRRQVAPKISP